MAPTEPNVLWQPGANDDTLLQQFWRHYESALHADFADYPALHSHSVRHPAQFWQQLWQFSRVCGTQGPTPLIEGATLQAARWFPGARLSFAENLLLGAGRHPGRTTRLTELAPAIIWRDETGRRDEISWLELRQAVADVAGGLTQLGVGIGDRVAAIVPNRIETVVIALAAGAIGAIWSSCSPDFGTRAIVDRFTQIAPTVLVGCSGYHYGGKYFDCVAKLAEVRQAVPTLRHVLMLDDADSPAGDDRDTLSAGQLASRITYGQLRTLGSLKAFPHFPFAQPLYVLFSSGTTGLPKCITHSAGGTLLKHLSEHQLHCDFREGERVLFFTTCGWMMWNWLVSALASGCTLCLYDGSPFQPSPGVLSSYVEEERVNHFGVSPGYLSALTKLDYRPRERHDLSSLRSVLSTGSPLAPELFRWSYAHLAPAVRLSSITGGTDIMGCFAMGNPMLPVRVGEIQCAALGMDVAFVDDLGVNASTGEQGELVRLRPFPSVPLGFWNDADHSRFRAAYFDRYPGLWHHGDFGEFSLHGGVVIHGRSDATLNRGGVRIGTAEIYRQLEAFPEILESLAVAQNKGSDLRVVLFLRLRDGVALDADLGARIRTQLRNEASPRHVPDVILAVPDLPRTRSGKLTELAVREVIHGRTVANLGALANPEALEYFKDLPALQS